MTPEEFLESGKKIMVAKRHDYSDGSIWQNFERQEMVAEWFKNPRDKVYATMLAVKLARLAVLLSTANKEPNNESIEDSFRDACNYIALWASDRLTQMGNEAEALVGNRNLASSDLNQGTYSPTFKPAQYFD